MIADLARALGLAKRGPRKRAARAFGALARRLRPTDIAIDCGANVGKFTTLLGATGATVHAFEPNPVAFAELARRTARLPNIELHQTAVADRAGSVKLYLHEFATEDPLKWSPGSSVFLSKRNVRQDSFITVVAIDFCAFLQGLDRDIALLKMDIEGAEVSVLEEMLAKGLHKRIGHAFVELHDAKIPELAGPSARLREAVNARGIANINLDWD